jgi:hypothetical protein
MLIALSLGSCQKQSLLSLAATVNIEKGTSGCATTIAQAYYPQASKDPRVRAGWFTGKPEQLTFVTDKDDKDDYQVSFPAGSPLKVPDPLIQGGGLPQSYSVRFLSAACLGDCKYSFLIQNTHTQQVCDPIVHVTK